MSTHENTSASLIYLTSDLTRMKLDFELFQLLKTYSPNQILLNIDCTAKYLCFSKSTLASWRSTKRHHLPFHKKGKDIHYFLSDLNTFIEKHASQPLTDTHHYKSLLDRKSAAKQIKSTSGTLAVWVTNKHPDLIYIKIGKAVRYRPYDLYMFNLERLRSRKPS